MKIVCPWSPWPDNRDLICPELTNLICDESNVFPTCCCCCCCCWVFTFAVCSILFAPWFPITVCCCWLWIFAFGNIVAILGEVLPELLAIVVETCWAEWRTEWPESRIVCRPAEVDTWIWCGGKCCWFDCNRLWDEFAFTTATFFILGLGVTFLIGGVVNCVLVSTGIGVSRGIIKLEVVVDEIELVGVVGVDATIETTFAVGGICGWAGCTIVGGSIGVGGSRTIFSSAFLVSFLNENLLIFRRIVIEWKY